MPPRFYVELPLVSGATLDLPSGPARHVQVLRLQPGAALTLFDGRGGEWQAQVARMGRSEVQILVGNHLAVDRELVSNVTLALGMPANDRMDTLVEKATELGVATIQPLLCERSVMRLSGERAERKVAHWRGVAVAACEQSGRTRVPQVHDMVSLASWLQTGALATGVARVLLSLRDARPWVGLGNPGADVVCLSGPEGGLTAAEEAAARVAGFEAVSLGPRVLRADTAPLALLAQLGLVGARPAHEAPP